MKKVFIILSCFCLTLCLVSCNDLLFTEKEEIETCSHRWATKTSGGSVTIPTSGDVICTPCTIIHTCLECGKEIVSKENPSLTLDYSEPGVVHYGDSEEVNVVIPQYVYLDNAAPIEITCVSNFYSTGSEAYHNIKSILLNESITKIEKSCFKNCYMLESICIPSNATIGDDAFKNCYVLRDLYFNNLVSIGESSFSTCYALKNVNPISAVENNISSFDKCFMLLESINQ